MKWDYLPTSIVFRASIFCLMTKERLKTKTFIINFGLHLKSIRKLHGLTQKQLAMSSGLNLSSISRIERGVARLS